MYERFHLQLITSLLIDDVIFLGLLREKNLFPGNLSDVVQAGRTNAQRAALFLDKVVDCAMGVGEFQPLNKLFTVMSDVVYLKNDSLKQLATKMRQELDKESSLIPSTGQLYIRTCACQHSINVSYGYTCIHACIGA